MTLITPHTKLSRVHKKAASTRTNAARSTLALTTALTLAIGGLQGASGVGLGEATAQDGSFYEGTDGSLRGAAELGSGPSLAIGSTDLAKDDFYSSLQEYIEGTPGEIIKTQPSTFALGLPGVDWTGSKATRIAYVSTDSNGKTVPVTGTVFQSSAPWKGKGPRPLMTIAPGTQGAGDACSPGKLIVHGLEYEGLPVAAALARGWNVALTDLHGLGTPAQHSYMNRLTQGYSTLDMARAAIGLGVAGINKKTPVVTWGYSQGGGASASALELAEEYAPELNLAAGYAGGVPADLFTTAQAIDNAPLAAALGYTINGFLYTNPELRPEMEKHLNAKGRLFLEQSANDCLPQSMVRHAYADTRDLTKDGRSIGEILQTEPIHSVVEGQRIGNKPPKVPVYVGHGTFDDTIPVDQSRRMSRQWCEGGTQVYYQEHNIPKAFPLADHMFPLFTHLQPAIEWLEQVLNAQASGEEGAGYPTTPCGQIPEPEAKAGDAGVGNAGNGSSQGSLEGAAETSSAGVAGSMQTRVHGSS